MYKEHFNALLRIICLNYWTTNAMKFAKAVQTRTVSLCTLLKDAQSLQKDEQTQVWLRAPACPYAGEFCYVSI